MPIERVDRVTNVVSFECEECGQVYKTEEEAFGCEESHEDEEHTH
jgi:Zn finger protein HypA/HybF involved in hydrogenase expression